MGLVQRVQGWRVVRAWQHYLDVHGPVFAQGMTLSGFFSLFAGLFLAFAAGSTILRADAELTDRVISIVAAAVPGLIDTGDGGAITVEMLLDASIASWAGVIGAVSIVLTAMRWIAVSREGFRAVLGLPDLRANIVLVHLGDLAVAFGVGALVLVSSLGLVVTSNVVEDWLGIRGLGVVLAAIAQLVLDVAITMLMFRFAGRLRLPWSRLLGAALACAVAFLVLKQLASLLFGGIDRNPLLASIATVAVILLWLGFTNQVLLTVLAFVAVGSVGTAYAERVATAVEDDERFDRIRAARKAEKAEEAETATRDERAFRKTARRLRRR